MPLARMVSLILGIKRTHTKWREGAGDLLNEDCSLLLFSSVGSHQRPMDHTTEMSIR